MPSHVGWIYGCICSGRRCDLWASPQPYICWLYICFQPGASSRPHASCLAIWRLDCQFTKCPATLSLKTSIADTETDGRSSLRHHLTRIVIFGVLDLLGMLLQSGPRMIHKLPRQRLLLLLLLLLLRGLLCCWKDLSCVVVWVFSTVMDILLIWVLLWTNWSCPWSVLVLCGMEEGFEILKETNY